MGKISPVSSKYIINATIDIEGVVDRPDVIGAVFGQTEGLLGSDLELRELQRSGRIGRIEVNVDTRSGKTKGAIIIPSSLDKAETAIVGAALEIIQRIGPCNAKVQVQGIEDVRVSKRNFVVERAKELLKLMIESTMPDSKELSDEVAYSVRVMEIQEYGKDRLPAGPAIDESDEIIVVEGRADVLNLLKHGIKNSIALNGTSVPATIVELSKKKVVTLFVDGDRGGSLITKELMNIADIDYVTRAPDGKEVEEITKKEIHMALRSRIAGEQIKLEIGKENHNGVKRQPPRYAPRPVQRQQVVKRREISGEHKQLFGNMLESLVGTRGAQILDEKMNVLGKVPITELETTIKSLTDGVYAVVFDGIIDRELARAAERSHIKYLVGMDTKISSSETRVDLITAKDL
ncbi:DNA primase [Candidatus Woesearchaeota archaeon]|nr:DNA primase [Candidatus Woesearchaeota archaeon]